MKRHEQKITKWDINKAEKFADARTNTEVYQARGGFKKDDIVNGALAEIAVAKFLQSNGIDVCEPDFTIYETKKKSFDADLTDGSRMFHVKGQSLSSVERYGRSWLMQKNDPIIRNPSRGHYLVPCVVDMEKRLVYIYGIIPILAIVDKDLISEPVVPWFRKTKVALYYDQMESIMTYNSMWGCLYRSRT